MTDAAVAVAPASSGTAIAFTFPLGRYHATAMGTSANDGIVEWPPSPWRLLRTLYSVWRTRCAGLDSATVERVLAALANPPHYWLAPDTAVAHTRHYMPGESSGKETTALVHDTFVVCRNEQPALYARWPDVDLDERERCALGELCAAITWLGRAESLADARLLDVDEFVPAPNSYVVPDSIADVGTAPIRLLVPSLPLDLEALTVRLADLRTDAKRRSTLPPRATLRTYLRPEPVALRPVKHTSAPRARPTFVRFSIVPWEQGRSAARLPLADTIVHTAALRRAVLSQYGRAFGGTSSATLSGRRGDDLLTGHGHAHYVAVPGDGRSSPADRVESFVIWAPDGFDDDEVRALRSVRRVDGFGWLSTSRRYRVIAEGVGEPAELLPEFCRVAYSWRSVTPVVPGRHPRSQRSWEDQIRAELVTDCAARGLPEPVVHVERWNGRFTTVRPRPGKPSHSAHPHRFVAVLEFPEPVGGDRMVCLGAHSHFGMGLLRPVS